MKKILLILLSLVVISCSDKNNETGQNKVNCINNDSTNTTQTQDSIRVTITHLTNDKPFVGVIVQLDNNGICVKSNDQGIVTFNAVSSGFHDVHVFSPPGYNWYSIYDITGGGNFNLALYDSKDSVGNREQPREFSSIFLTGLVSTEFVAGDNLEFVFYSEKLSNSTNEIINFSGGKYAVEFEFNAPVGTSVTGDILVLEFKSDKNTGERYLVNKAVITNATYITKAVVTGTANNVDSITKNINFSINPTVSTLLSFDQITLPTGLSASISIIYSVPRKIVSSNYPNLPLNYKTSNFDFNISPITFKSYEPFKFNEYSFYIDAYFKDSYNEIFWTMVKFYSNNTGFTNIVQDPMIKTIPRFNVQQGNQITWTALSKNIGSQQLTISDIELKQTSRSWFMFLNNTSTMVTLPNIPNGVTRLLTKGNNYKVELKGSVNNTIKYTEIYSVISKSWTR